MGNLKCFDNKDLLFPGIVRTDSIEDELDETTVEEGGEEEKGK